MVDTSSQDIPDTSWRKVGAKLTTDRVPARSRPSRWPITRTARSRQGRAWFWRGGADPCRRAPVLVFANHRRAAEREHDVIPLVSSERFCIGVPTRIGPLASKGRMGIPKGKETVRFRSPWAIATTLPNADLADETGFPAAARCHHSSDRVHEPACCSNGPEHGLR